jgi:uncharacterized protein (DUF2062 family)
MPSLAAQLPSQPPRTFWQRRVVEPVVRQMTQGISPEKIALTLAVGSACGVFPVPGTTTLLCLFVGIGLRLNQAIIQVVNGVLTPIHVALFFLFVNAGDLLTGTPHVKVGFHALETMIWDDPRHFLRLFDGVIFHALLGWAVLAPIWIVLTYNIALPTLREIKRQRAVAASGQMRAELPEPPDHPVP